MNRRFRIVMAAATFWLSASVALALLVPPTPVSARSAHATATAIVAPPGGWARQPIAPGPAPTEADGFLGYDSATGHLLYFNGIFGDPRAPGISFVTGSRVTVQWDPPASPVPVFGGFTIWRADEFLIVLVGATTTYTSDPIVGHSCWYVRAHDGAGWSGRTSTVCGLPEYGSR